MRDLYHHIIWTFGLKHSNWNLGQFKAFRDYVKAYNMDVRYYNGEYHAESLCGARFCMIGKMNDSEMVWQCDPAGRMESEALAATAAPSGS